jgi:hypothetical protein
MAVCSNCGHEGTGKYCSECGQSFVVKRITFSSLLHEVAHIFTHFEKGFGYTLKQLATRPGRMQKDYLLGHRSRHQKPFSMFFLCATLAGLAIYWISNPASPNELSSFDEMRVHFYRHYFVIFQCLMLPFYSLVTWTIFWSRNLNYAEALVLFVYSLAFCFLLIIFTNAINLIPHHFETYLVELPLLAGYQIWTNLNFFNKEPRWLVVLKSVISLLICWFASNLITDQVIRWMM